MDYKAVREQYNEGSDYELFIRRSWNNSPHKEKDDSMFACSAFYNAKYNFRPEGKVLRAFEILCKYTRAAIRRLQYLFPAKKKVLGNLYKLVGVARFAETLEYIFTEALNITQEMAEKK